MPNVAPRGLYARNGLAWKPPANVFARVAGAWKQADYVWAFHNGVWRIVWGRVPSQPLTAVATWVQPATVRIDWTAPAISSNSHWIVRRTDGSIVATVPVGTLTVTDTRPLLGNTGTGNSTVSYTVEGFDGEASSPSRATNVLTFNLNAASLAVSAGYPDTLSATITLNWTPNATYGLPQGWQAYLDGYGFAGSVLPGSATTVSFAGQARGSSQDWRIVPMTLNAAGQWVQAGNYNPVNVNIAPGPPTNVQCFASGISQLCGSFWGPASGYVYDYHIQYWKDGVWVDWAYVPGGGPHCWPSTTGGYFRVASRAGPGPRTQSAADNQLESEWVQCGPVWPVNDGTGPGPSALYQWAPEASYGRMVVRGRWSDDTDTTTGQIFVNSGGGWFSVWGPSRVYSAQGIVLHAYSAGPGQTVSVLVRTWDALGNINSADAVASYYVVDRQGIFNPTDGWTGLGGGWRQDGVAGQYSLLQGLGNIGYLFYGNQLTDYLVGRTWQGGWMSVWRQNSQGSGSGIQPGLVSHEWASRPDGPPQISNQGQDCLGATALARTGQAAGTLGICNQIAQLIQANWKGLALWRGGASSSDPNNPNSFYMKFGDTGSNGYDLIMGQVVLTCLG